MLVILKTGAAFLLIDLSQALQRLQDICQELFPPQVLATNDQRALAEQLIPNIDVFVVGDEQLPTWENRSTALPPVNPSGMGSSCEPDQCLWPGRM